MRLVVISRIEDVPMQQEGVLAGARGRRGADARVAREVGQMSTLTLPLPIPIP